MKYRPEIDGLRAIAVMSVLIYHAKFIVDGNNILSGGYLGVDIFFVISGYLITSILLREIDNNNFHFSRFYERRARRILPALFLVLAVSIPFAWVILLPAAMQQYAGSALASLGFVSNFFFWLEDSYTAAPSQLKPLLHTWSLSVEEQFYLFFPPLILLISWLNTRNVLPAMIILFVASLVLAEYGSRAFVDVNFFLIASRIWELMCGAILAKLQFDESPQMDKLAYKPLSWMAFLALILSIVLFDQTTAHPSLLTLIPVISTVILIANKQPPQAIYRLLASRPMVFIGLISYSLYLWHFPIFAFSRIQNLASDISAKLILIGLSFGAAIAAYYLFEKPLRNRQKWSAKLLVFILGIGFISLAGVFSYLYVSKGVPERLGPVAGLFEQAKADIVTNGDYNVDEASSRIINVGDSHAEVFGRPLKRLATKHKLNFSQMIQPGCPLAPGIFRFDQGKLIKKCSGLQNRWFDHALSYAPSIFVYSSRFNLYLDGQRFDNGEGGVEPGHTLLITTDQSGKQDIEGVKNAISAVIRRLLGDGHKVVLIYPIPEVGWNVPNLVKAELDAYPVGLKMSKFESLEISTSIERYKQRSRQTYTVYDAIPDNQNLIRFYPSEFLCDKASGRCQTHNKTSLYYYDDNHLTPYYATKLIHQLELVMANKGWFIE